MKINLATYLDKMYACWVGKNIGGTMGTPYECTRQMNDIQGFVTDANVVLPNDDLDLQLVWLYALETGGIAGLDAKRLGEFWLSYISPHWNEYGIGKANMKLGIQPPLSGDCFNEWKESNGAWIRTEIWASLAPGAPDVAMKYAYEDACVDHGTAEGTIAAMFVAALESAAYVESDRFKLIDVALSKIPEESRVAKSIRLLLELYAKGVDYKTARNAIFEQNSDIGDGWFEAPSNVAYTIIGLIWGEGDFKKSMTTAINCGDDTDCTGATVGATMGILYGMAGIPEDWRQYIGDEIITVSIAKGNNGKSIPKTCTELTERIVRVAPEVLTHNSIKHSNYTPDGAFSDFSVELADKDEFSDDVFEKLVEFTTGKIKPVASGLLPYSIYEENVFMRVQIALDKEPEINPNEEIGLTVFFNSKCCFEDEPRNVTMRWILPEGFTVSGRKSLMVHGFNPHSTGQASTRFVIKAGEHVEAMNRAILEIVTLGRCTPMYISVPLLG